MPDQIEEPQIERFRRLIEEQYQKHPTGSGDSFGEILCYELHPGGLTFVRLAHKWGLSLSMLGALVADHCRRLELDPFVDHSLSPLQASAPAVYRVYELLYGDGELATVVASSEEEALNALRFYQVQKGVRKSMATVRTVREPEGDVEAAFVGKRQTVVVCTEVLPS